MAVMKEIWVAHYIAKFGDGGMLDDFIATWTFPFMPLTPRCSHSELVFPEVGLSFSFTKRDGVNGARFTNAKKMFRHPERWLITRIWVTPDDHKKLFEYCRGEIGKTYSIEALALGFALYVGTDGKKSNYCSRGGVAWPLHHIGVLKKRYHVISPRRLYKVLKKLKFITVELTEEMVKSLNGVPEKFLGLAT